MTNRTKNREYRVRISGFTLIELIMMMVIIGILSAMAIPRMMAPDTFNVYLGTQQVRNDLRYGVDYALSTGHAVRVDFNVPGDRYTLYYRDTAGVWQNLTRPGSGENIDINVVDLGLVLTSVDINGGNQIYFNSQGVPLDSAFTEMTIGMTSELIVGTTTLSISPVSAMIIIEG